MDTVVDYKGGKPVLRSELIGRWGRASEASGRIGCIANLAKRWCTVELSQFDTDPMLLNCMNGTRSEEHTSELQSLMRISYAVFCLKKKTKHIQRNYETNT